jgi:predicted RNase H-like nuclease
MRFLGIDFGWRSQPSGVAQYAPDLGVETTRLTSPGEIVAWVEQQAGGGPAIVAIDAPLVIPNETGMRLPDKLMHTHFGRYHAGCYPANQRLPFAPRVLELSRRLSELGFVHAASLTPRQPGRYQIEVYPHVAAIQLFRLDRILKYKKGTLAERLPELRRYRRLLAMLVGKGLPRVPSAGLTAMKAVEDRLDAALCAYVGCRWWSFGLDGSEVFGDEASGYIVAPRRASANETQAS